MKFYEILMIVFMIAVIVASLCFGPRPVAAFAASVLVVALRGRRSRVDYFRGGEIRIVTPRGDPLA